MGGAAVNTAHPGLAGKRYELQFRRSPGSPYSPAPQPVLLFDQYNYTAAFWCLISKRCELSNLCEIHNICIINCDQFDSLPVAKGNGAGFVKKKHIHVSCCFDSSSRCRNDIAPDKPVHTGYPYCAEKSPDSGRSETNKEGNKYQ